MAIRRCETCGWIRLTNSVCMGFEVAPIEHTLMAGRRMQANGLGMDGQGGNSRSQAPAAGGRHGTGDDGHGPVDQVEPKADGWGGLDGTG